MRWIVLLYAASVIYAIVRYIVFMPMNLEHLPVFIVNKGVSMAAAICFAAGFFQRRRRQRGFSVAMEPATWFRAGLFGAIVHIPASLVILRPAYFPEFFTADRLSFAGELVFLFGGLTAGGLFLLTRTGWPAATRWRLSLAVMLTLLTHVLSMGYCRGLNFNRSHAYLPPMWLLSVLAVALALWWLLRSRPGANETMNGEA